MLMTFTCNRGSEVIVILQPNATMRWSRGNDATRYIGTS